MLSVDLDYSGDETVHLLTVRDGAVTDCPLFDRQPIQIHDAAHGIVLLSTNYGALWMLDIASRTLHDTGFSNDTIFNPILSPDATQAAVEVGQPNVGWQIQVIDLKSGADRTVRQTGPYDYNRAGLVPRHWLPSGILVSPGVWDCTPEGVLKLDPSTGSLTSVANGETGVFSQSGAYRAFSGYSNLGDRQYQGQCGWRNVLFTGPLGGASTTVRSEANHDFSPLDVRDDGSLLYASDDLGAEPPTATTPDMGLYLYTGSASIKQFGEDHNGEWQSAVFVTPQLAIASEQISSGQVGSVEVVLVSLCASINCQASATAIENPRGPYSSVGLVVVRP